MQAKNPDPDLNLAAGSWFVVCLGLSGTPNKRRTMPVPDRLNLVLVSSTLRFTAHNIYRYSTCRFIRKYLPLSIEHHFHPKSDREFSVAQVLWG